jgi:uncharacterized protein YjbI with pentapeptide repeats
LVDDSDLSGSRFSGTRLKKSTFEDFNLRQTSFHVNLSNASIENANVSGMRIEDVLVS